MRGEMGKTDPQRIALRAPQATPHNPPKRKLKITFHAACGIFFVVIGVIALIHPNFTLPGKKNTVTIAHQRVVIETHRVISIPRAASAAEVALGIGLIVFGSIAPPRRRSY